MIKKTDVHVKKIHIYIHMYIIPDMPSKTIMVRKPVYEALRKEMRPGESFSRLFERLLSKRRGLSGCVGLWGRGK